MSTTPKLQTESYSVASVPGAVVCQSKCSRTNDALHYKHYGPKLQGVLSIPLVIQSMNDDCNPVPGVLPAFPSTSLVPCKNGKNNYTNDTNGALLNECKPRRSLQMADHRLAADLFPLPTLASQVDCAIPKLSMKTRRTELRHLFPQLT